MRRFAVVVSVVLSLGAVGTAGADPTHTSCAGFGANTATLAQGPGLGGLASALATSGPNALSNLVQTVEHPEFCTPK
jgi:hypothetical protein